MVMRKADRYKAIVEYFSEKQPEAQTELYYENPYQLLVAVILSAQCTDKRVNMVTPKLFEDFPNLEALANSTPEVVFEYIRSISYPNNKAKHLVGMARMVLSDFNGEIPQTVQELQKLPGVGRKTANVVASVIYDIPAIAVDTHVFRVSHRLGLSMGKTPLAVEKDLNKFLPKDKWAIAHHWLILHGRYVCIARSPKCDICEISHICKYYLKNN